MFKSRDMGRAIAVKRWTPTALECYKRGCRCANCPMFNILGDRCQMKVSVVNLVRRFGAPGKVRFNENR